MSNPFRHGITKERVLEPCAMVIFGATGDLTRRKLMPALYHLARERRLPADFAVVGTARKKWSDDEFRDRMREGAESFSRKGFDTAVWDEFARGLFFSRGDFDDAASYERLGARLREVAGGRGTQGNTLFYLATPPRYYAPIIEHLGRSGLSGSSGAPWSRIIIEKPFGRDLPSARELNSTALRVFDERQVYRIDHYLGKETVQNILVIRFGNGIFEPLWNQKYVEHVQITVAESLGMEGRGSYYDRAGAMRDMVQNHMLQLLCLTAMEPPVAFEAEAVRNEKLKVLQAIRPMDAEAVARGTVRAQYTRGFVVGADAPGYLQEEGVAADSETETYVALRLHVDNWRWAGVPFYLRSGKRLPKRVTEIAIRFREAPYLLFGAESAEIEPNVLALRIQPDEGISLKMTSKVPGTEVRLRPVVMDFRYGTSFGAEPPEAYERLLLDAIGGDPTLFTRRDEAEAAWEFVDGILGAWSSGSATPMQTYEAGSWGPARAAELLDHWRRP